MQVLIVESDPEVASMLAAVLVEEGHTAEVVPHRRAALDAARARRFDACVCDGFGSHASEPSPADLAELAALQSTTPVVLCTAHTWAVQLGPGALGISAVVPKPFELDELLRLLETIAPPVH